MKPLSAWVVDVMYRIDFIRDWIEKGIPAVFWISGFYFPQVCAKAVLVPLFKLFFSMQSCRTVLCFRGMGR